MNNLLENIKRWNEIREIFQGEYNHHEELVSLNSSSGIHVNLDGIAQLIELGYKPEFSSRKHYRTEGFSYKVAVNVDNVIVFSLITEEDKYQLEQLVQIASSCECYYDRRELWPGGPLGEIEEGKLVTDDCPIHNRKQSSTLEYQNHNE